MTPQAVCKTSWPMDAFRFVAKLPDQLIVDGLRTQPAVFSDPMTIAARGRSRRSKDEIAMGIQRLALRGVQFGLAPDILTSCHSLYGLTRNTESVRRCHSRSKQNHEGQSNHAGI